MKKADWKALLPYVGIPAVGIALWLVRMGRAELLALLMDELLLVFGYVVAVQDIKEKRVPNKLIGAMLLGWVLIIFPQLLLQTTQTVRILIQSGIGFLLGGTLFLLVYFISRKGLGGGDVKFMAAAGLYLGFYRVLSAMLYGAVLLAVVGGVLILLKKIGRKDTLPFIPFLYIGMLPAVFFM